MKILKYLKIVWVLVLAAILGLVLKEGPLEILRVVLAWIVIYAAISGIFRIEKHLSGDKRIASPLAFSLFIVLVGELPYIREGNRVVLISFICLFAMLYFSFFIFSKIAESTQAKITPLTAINRIFLTTGSGVIVFAFTFTEIYRINPNSFVVINAGAEWLTQLVTFFYFSVITFATVGFGDISPANTVSRLLVCLEVLFAINTVAYAISLFTIIYEEFKDKPWHPHHHHEEEHHSPSS